MIDTAFAGSHLFAGHAERIFIGQKKKGEIIVPQIFVKTIEGGEIQKRFYLLIDPGNQFLPAALSPVKILKNAGELPQDAVFPQIPVQY